MISGILFDLSKKNLLLCSEFLRPKPEICQTITVPKSKCLSFLTLSLAIRSQWSLCILAFCTTTTARRSLLILANSNQNEKKTGIIFLRSAKYHVVLWRCLQCIHIIYLSAQTIQETLWSSGRMLDAQAGGPSLNPRNVCTFF